MPLYHVSQSNLDGVVVYPSIPSNYMTRYGYEDNNIYRISYCPSIKGCLRGLSCNLKSMILYVHEPASYDALSIITPVNVPDSYITGEVWVLNQTHQKLIQIIRVIKSTTPYKYSYGFSRIATLYDWDYEVLERFKL